MKIINTPDSYFENLKDYPFAANYHEVQEGLRMHYVDEGEGQTILLLHGEPSWSYLYRKMIPILVGNGFRCIAPDLVGFGKSSKIVGKEHYTFKSHLGWLTSLLEHLNLMDVHLFCQDWGGLLGLRSVVNNPDMFSTITVSNTFLPHSGIKATAAFIQWRNFSQNSPFFDCAGVLQMGTVSTLNGDILKAYNAPFPDDSYKDGAKTFPALVPFDDEDAHNEIPNCDAAWKVLSTWDKPFLTLFGDSDDIMKNGDLFFQSRVPGAKGQSHKLIENAGHFIQEDKGEELAALLSDFIKSNN